MEQSKGSCTSAPRSRSDRAGAYGSRRDRGPPRGGAPAGGRGVRRRVKRVSVASATACGRTRARTIEPMAITQRPLAVRRDLIKIFGEDRLVAVIRTNRPD